MMETKRLILRPVQMGDAEDIFDYATDEDTGPRAGWKPHENIEGTRSLIKMWLGGEKGGVIEVYENYLHEKVK